MSGPRLSMEYGAAAGFEAAVKRHRPSVFAKGKAIRYRIRRERQGRFVFKNYKVYMFALFFTTLETLSFQRGFTNIRKFQGMAYLIPYIFMIIFLGLPLMLSQIFLGQYARVGALNLWRISPVAAGIGYSMLIVSVIRVIGKGRLSSVALTHVVMAMKNPLPWANCDFHRGPGPCIFDKNDNVSLDMVNQSCCKIPVNAFSICPEDQRLLLPFSARLWNEQNFFDKVFSVEDKGLGSLHTHLSSILLITWLIVFLALWRKIGILNIVLVPLGTIIGVMFFLLALITFFNGGKEALTGIKFFFELKIEAFQEYELWVDCVEKSLESLHMICGSFIIYSSYAPKTSNPISTTVAVGFLKTIIGLFFMFMYSAFGGIIAHSLGAPPVCVQNVGWASVQANPAQFFASLPYPNVSTIMYYLLLFMTDIVYMVLLLFAVLESVLDARPKFREYYFYIVLGLCCLCLLASLPLTAEAGTHLNRNVALVNMNSGTLNLGLYTVMVMWVYGVVRLSDDIQFFTGKAPSKFWTSMWYFSPIPILLVLAPRSYVELRDMHDRGSQILKPFYLVLACLIISPVVFVAVYKCTVYFKARRLLMVILPSREWGPSDKEEKRRRIHFNPRKIIRFRIDAPLKCRPPGLLTKKQLKVENDRLEAHRKIFLEYINDKEEQERIEQERIEQERIVAEDIFSESDIDILGNRRPSDES